MALRIKRVLQICLDRPRRDSYAQLEEDLEVLDLITDSETSEQSAASLILSQNSNENQDYAGVRQPTEVRQLHNDIAHYKIAVDTTARADLIGCNLDMAQNLDTARIRTNEDSDNFNAVELYNDAMWKGVKLQKTKEEPADDPKWLYGDFRTFLKQNTRQLCCLRS